MSQLYFVFCLDHYPLHPDRRDLQIVPETDRRVTAAVEVEVPLVRTDLVTFLPLSRKETHSIYSNPWLVITLSLLVPFLLLFIFIDILLVMIDGFNIFSLCESI